MPILEQSLMNDAPSDERDPRQEIPDVLPVPLSPEVGAHEDTPIEVINGALDELLRNEREEEERKREIDHSPRTPH